MIQRTAALLQPGSTKLERNTALGTYLLQMEKTRKDAWGTCSADRVAGAGLIGVALLTLSPTDIPNDFSLSGTCLAIQVRGM